MVSSSFVSVSKQTLLYSMSSVRPMSGAAIFTLQPGDPSDLKVVKDNGECVLDSWEEIESLKLLNLGEGKDLGGVLTACSSVRRDATNIY